jgi:polyisoprenoid-binding protein YceI
VEAQESKMSTTQIQQGTTTWDIDTVHSTIEISAKHMMFTTVKARFTTFSGTVVMHDADPTQSLVTVQIDANSITSGNEQRDNHLRTSDFLDVPNNPTITFSSTRVEPQSGNRLKVIGELTMRGVTKEVALDAEFLGQGTNPWGGQVAGFTAETTVNRKDWGVNWNAPLEAGGVLVSDTLRVNIDIQAVKREQ